MAHHHLVGACKWIHPKVSFYRWNTKLWVGQHLPARCSTPKLKRKVQMYIIYYNITILHIIYILYNIIYIYIYIYIISHTYVYYVYTISCVSPRKPSPVAIGHTAMSSLMPKTPPVRFSSSGSSVAFFPARPGPRRGLNDGKLLDSGTNHGFWRGET